MAPKQTPGRAIALDQHAVNAVANADSIFERLDMDIRRPQLHGFGDDHLDEPDDRGAGFIDNLFGGGGSPARFR